MMRVSASLYVYIGYLTPTGRWVFSQKKKKKNSPGGTKIDDIDRDREGVKTSTLRCTSITVPLAPRHLTLTLLTLH